MMTAAPWSKHQSTQREQSARLYSEAVAQVEDVRHIIGRLRDRKGSTPATRLLANRFTLAETALKAARFDVIVDPTEGMTAVRTVIRMLASLQIDAEAALACQEVA